MEVSSGAEKGQLLEVVSGCRVAFRHGLREEGQHWVCPREPNGRGCVRDAWQLCPVHGHQGQGQPLGLLGTGTALGPAPQSPSSQGRWAAGATAHGGLSPLCHSATTQQRSSHNAPGQVKRGHPPVSSQSARLGHRDTAGLGAAPRHPRRTPWGAGGITWRGLREQDQRLHKAAGGSLLQGQLLAGPPSKLIWWRETLFSWTGVAQPREYLLEEHFQTHLMEANPFQLDGSGTTKGGISSWGALQSSPPSAPAKTGAAAIRSRMQKCCQGSHLVLWSTHWCPARHGKGSYPKGGSGQGHVATLWSPGDGCRLREKRAQASSGRRDQPVGPGGRSCSHTQGTADRQHWGQEGIFPWGALALVLGVFRLPLQHRAGLLVRRPPVPLGWLTACCSYTMKMASRALQLAGGRFFFPPGWAGNCAREFFAFLCSTEHRPLARAPLGHSGHVPAAHAPPRWPSCPAPGVRSLLHSQGDPQGWPSGLAASLQHWAHPPVRAPLGHLGLSLACCSCTTSKAPLVPWLSRALSHCKVVVAASSALPLAPLVQGFLLVQNSLCLEQLQACCTIKSCSFSALPAGNTSAGQAREHFSCSTGQEGQRSKFGKAKSVLVIDGCPPFEKTPQHYTPPPLLLLLLGVLSPDPHSSWAHSSGLYSSFL